MKTQPTLPLTLFCLLTLAFAPAAQAHDPEYTDSFGREHCTFATTNGPDAYFPLWPGYRTVLEGEEEDDGEIVEIEAIQTVLHETEVVDGVETRVFEERESEDGELVEVSRNFFAVCRETGDVWYFGEDVDDYEDGMIVGHGGAWRAGENGNRPGIVMFGAPIVGARYYEEFAPGVALDRGEVVEVDGEVVVPAGTFDDVVTIEETDELEPGAVGEKQWARGVGNIVDEELLLTERILPPCLPDDTTLCLADGRFRVQVDFEVGGNEGLGHAILPSGDSGEFWFFDPNNTEILVKVLDACAAPEFDHFWVFAAGLTDVELTIEVTDTLTGTMREYDNEAGHAFSPVQDTMAFPCP